MSKVWSRKMIENEVSGLPFLRKASSCHMTKEQQNARIIVINKFYKDINGNVVLCQYLNNNCSNFGLKIFLGRSDH